MSSLKIALAGDTMLGRVPARRRSLGHFTHCGSQVVAGDTRVIQTDVAALGRERGVRAEIAHDGMEVAVP